MITAREITAPELVNLHTDNQWVEWGLYIVNPPAVFTCQLNGVPNYKGGLTDNISVLTYDGASGIAYSAIKPDSTILVGVAPGDDTYGQVRFRAATATTITIARTSQVIWYDNAYLTVLDEVGLWPRQQWFNIITGTFTCDDDIVYTDQHKNPAPVPVLGPDRIVELTGATVVVQLDASDSWVFGGTISSYLWTASVGVVLSSQVIANPTATFSAAGSYYVDCLLTASNGKTYTGRRVIAVYDAAHPLINQFTIKNLTGEWTDGGWSFDVDLYAQASLPTVRERALVFLVGKQYYNNLQVDQGPVAGMERQICSGWISKESIEWSAELSTVKFSVKGPQWWLDQTTSWQAALTDSVYSPVNWMYFANLTFDKFCWHVLTYRSTATRMMDFYPSGDTRRTVGISMQFGSVWSQIKSAGENKFYLFPCCNRFGQLFIQLDPQYCTLAQRSAFPVIQVIGKTDWYEILNIERRTVPATSFVDATGMSWAGGPLPSGYRSGSYGSSISRHGKYEHRTELVVSGQSQCNDFAGLIMGNGNNPLPNLTIKLAQQNFFYDICPHQYAFINVAAGDTPRGIVLTNQQLVVRGISFDIDNEKGTVLPVLTAEGASIPALAVTLPFPTDYTPPPPYNPPPTGCTTGTAYYIPPAGCNVGGSYYTPPGCSVGSSINPPPPGGGDCITESQANGPFVVATGMTIYGGTFAGAWGVFNPIYKCMIRATGAANPSRVALTGAFEKTLDSGATWVPDLAMTAYTLQACDANGTIIATVVWDAVTDNGHGTRYGTISAPAPVNIYSWLLTISGSAIPIYTKYGDPLFIPIYTQPPNIGPVQNFGEPGADSDPTTSGHIGWNGFPLTDQALYCAESIDGFESGPWEGTGAGDMYTIMVWPVGAVCVDSGSPNYRYGNVEHYEPINPADPYGFNRVFFKFIDPTYVTVMDGAYPDWFPDNTGNHVLFQVSRAYQQGDHRLTMDSLLLYNVCPWAAA